MDSYSIGTSFSRNPCDVQLGCGRTYAVTVPDADVLEAEIDRLLAMPGSEVCTHDGGLVCNVSVVENIALPAVYHGRGLDSFGLERDIAEAFSACGLNAEAAHALYYRRPGELTPFEQRLAGFIRALVMRPEVIVYARFLEGLTHEAMERAAGLNQVFFDRSPRGTAIYLDVRGMLAHEVPCDHKMEL
jgi:hypothetical protein